MTQLFVDFDNFSPLNYIYLKAFLTDI